MGKISPETLSRLFPADWERTYLWEILDCQGMVPDTLVGDPAGDPGQRPSVSPAIRHTPFYATFSMATKGVTLHQQFDYSKRVLHTGMGSGGGAGAFILFPSACATMFFRLAQFSQLYTLSTTGHDNPNHRFATSSAFMEDQGNYTIYLEDATINLDALCRERTRGGQRIQLFCMRSLCAAHKDMHDEEQYWISVDPRFVFISEKYAGARREAEAAGDFYK